MLNIFKRLRAVEDQLREHQSWLAYHDQVTGGHDAHIQHHESYLRSHGLQPKRRSKPKPGLETVPSPS
jgi:hypothetical protein